MKFWFQAVLWEENFALDGSGSDFAFDLNGPVRRSTIPFTNGRPAGPCCTFIQAHKGFENTLYLGIRDADSESETTTSIVPSAF